MRSIKLNQLFFPNDNKKEHFRGLDGLRGIAVLIVLLSHSSNENLFFHEFLNFEKSGKIGVYLFFLLSSYLLDRQITLALMKGQASKGYWKNYFFRRFSRIYPLFVFALGLNWIFSYVGINTAIERIADIPLHLILVKGESIFWSIPVEFKYYFISPLIVWFCFRLKWDKLKILLILLILLLSSIIIELIFHLPKLSTYRYFPIFLVGTFVAIFELLYKKETIRLSSSRIFKFVGFMAVFILIITMLFSLKIYSVSSL